MMYRRYVVVIAIAGARSLAAACAKKKPPVARPDATAALGRRRTPAIASAGAARAGAGAAAGSRPSRLPPTRCRRSDIDTLNRNSPFQPVFFAYDQDTIDDAGQQALNGNAALMKKYPTWIVTIEGHSDERGTAEYNLALGERRALAARNYLVSLGHPGRPAADGQLRQGISVRARARRGLVVEEPPRAFRRDEQVAVQGSRFRVPGSNRTRWTCGEEGKTMTRRAWPSIAALGLVVLCAASAGGRG